MNTQWPPLRPCPGCGQRIPPKLLVCDRCWPAVPAALRRDVHDGWAAWLTGGPVTGYLNARRAVLDWFERQPTGAAS